MSRRQRPKVRGKKNVLDERDWADIDRDEQKAGLKRRERRWKEIELEKKRRAQLEKKAIKNADKMVDRDRNRPLHPLEEAWIRCDFVLYHLMNPDVYTAMEWLRFNDLPMYQAMYKRFMPKQMMRDINECVEWFAKGGEVRRISMTVFRKAYLKYKGYKPTVKVKHKGEKEYDL